MESLKVGSQWLDELLPRGLPINTSTLLSGPGGSGKPLVGDGLVAAWLRAGGSVVFMCLQYPSTTFIYESLKAVSELDLGDYSQRFIFLSLDVTLDSWTGPEGNIISANLLKPQVWGSAIEAACSRLPLDGPGVLVFGSALNLLLFSPTYGSSIFRKMEQTLRDDKRRTYVFSVSTSAKQEQIAQLERLADNLMITRSEPHPFTLYLQIVRVKDAPFSGVEVRVPIPPNSLARMKQIADHSRRRVIPQVSRI